MTRKKAAPRLAEPPLPTQLEASRSRYNDLYDLVPTGYFAVTGQGLIREANQAAALLLGVAASALSGKPLSGFVFPEDRDACPTRYGESREKRAQHSWEARMVRADGSLFWAQLEDFPARDGGSWIALNDISEHKELEDARDFLVKSECLPSEKDFFYSIARYLGERLGMDYVCVDRLRGNELAARTLAVYFDGHFEDNVEYALKDTPCGEVVGNAICRFDTGVRHLFPRDVVLQEMAAESYVGTTLWGCDGKPIGLIALIGRKPLANPRRVEALLKLVALRAAGELERTQAEADLRESEERYRVISEASGDLIWLADSDGRLHWQNSSSQGILGALAADHSIFSRVHPDDAPRFAAAWLAARVGNEPDARICYRLRMPGAGHRILESTFRKVSFAGEERWCVVSRDETELVRLKQRASVRNGIKGMVGHDPAMIELYASIRDLAESDVPVLIQGESGTGKELVAAAIHREGPRAGKHFIAINCGSIPDALLETELFGHVKGAFTGAHRDRKGRFELADGGTIFLDEVGDLSQAMQVKLLRVLQEGVFERVGSATPIRVDVRLISATNRDLEREVSAGRFREDLFYRVSVVPLVLPPLRERLTDIPLLVEHFLGEESRRSGRRDDPARPPRNITPTREALALLIAHRWPGNIRELQNVLRYALVKCKGELLGIEHLPRSVRQTAHDNLVVLRGRKPKLTAEMAAQALNKAGGYPGEAARLLGVSRSTLYRHLPKIDD